MPLLDANGQPISQSGSGGTLSLDALGAGDTLFNLVVSYLLGELNDWLLAGLLDFDGDAVAVGVGVGVGRFPLGVTIYSRYVFRGLSANLQFGNPDAGIPWETFATVGAVGAPSFSIFTNLLHLLAPFFDALEWLAGEGQQMSFLGRAPVSARGDSMATGDTVKLVVQIAQFDAEPLQIAHHFRAADTTATFDNLESEYRTAALTPLSQLLHQSASIVAVKVEDRINVVAPTLQRKTRTYNASGTYPVAGAITAGGATGGEAPQLAACLTWESPFAGRGERGRTFLPGMADNASEGGLLTDAYKVLAQAYADALVNNFGVDLANVPVNGANHWVFVLWREHLSNPALPSGNTNPAGAVARTLANPSGYAFPPVTKPPFNPRAAANGVQAGIVRDVVRTQRRRGRGVRIGRRRTIA